MKKDDMPNFEIVYTTSEAAAVLKIRSFSSSISSEANSSELNDVEEPLS